MTQKIVPRYYMVSQVTQKIVPRYYMVSQVTQKIVPSYYMVSQMTQKNSAQLLYGFTNDSEKQCPVITWFHK